MDLKLNASDRVTANNSRKKKSRKAPQRGKTAARAANGRGKPRRSGRKAGKGGKLTLGRVFRFCFYWGMVAAIWAFIGIAGVVVYYGAQLPAANTWAVPERPANIRIVAADGQLISNRGKMGGEAVSYTDLPYYVPEAVMAIEDRRFMDHFGIDPVGIARALVGNLMAGHITAGGSTITQQLAKNLFLTPDQTLGRKVQEMLLALWLERNYTKEQILELYLNRVYFGAGAHGIEAASERYFGKSARNLSLGEAAILAGLLQAPSRLSPDTHPDAAAARARVVLQAMADEGYISQKEAEAAAIDPNKRIRTRVPGAEYYVADWVETLMESYIGKVDQDVIVHTTIDWDLQKEAEFDVKEAVRKYGEDKDFSQGALVAMDTDGAVKAIVGGTDYTKSQYNRAVTARRQTGSAFKPFVYLTALQHGYTPDTPVLDAPFTYDGWSPHNDGDKYYGEIPLRDGLAFSLNSVAARLSVALGPANIRDTAYRLGISSPLQAVPSIALGTQNISLLELTAAYAPFANGGNGVIAHVITSIETPDGKVLYQETPAGPGRVMTPEEVGEMNNMLEANVDVGTGRHADLPGWQIGGKTGTSQKSRDAVFVGYSARMITGVWFGNDDDSSTKLYGGTVPAETWTAFMKKAHQSLVPANLPGNYKSTITEGPPAEARNGGRRDAKTIGDLLNGIFGGN